VVEFLNQSEPAMKRNRQLLASFCILIAMTLYPSSGVCQERFNANPKGLYQLGEMFIGVKKVIHYSAEKNKKEKMQFPVKGMENRAELVLTASSRGPLRLAVNWPTYKQATLLDVASHVPAAFTGGVLKDKWILQATVYDIKDDGIPEVVVGINRWDGDYWDANTLLTMLVYRFRVPKNTNDLGDSKNWVFTGVGKGQTLILFDKDRIILPIGSSDSNLYLLRHDRLIDAGGAWKDANGRYKPYK